MIMIINLFLCESIQFHADQDNDDVIDTKTTTCVSLPTASI